MAMARAGITDRKLLDLGGEGKLVFGRLLSEFIFLQEKRSISPVTVFCNLAF